MEKSSKKEQIFSDGTKTSGKVRPSDHGTSQEFLRAENEDDDGYDPYSDRPFAQERLFEEDPWR